MVTPGVPPGEWNRLIHMHLHPGHSLACPVTWNRGTKHSPHQSGNKTENTSTERSTHGIAVVNYPTQVLHVYRLNIDVDSRNALMLDNLAPQSAQYTIKARDARAGQTTHISLSAISDKRSETGGLHGILKLAIGARVMLTTNVDVSDGLVNGARGEVVHVVTNSDGEITLVLVKFDNSSWSQEYPNQSVSLKIPSCCTIGKIRSCVFCQRKARFRNHMFTVPTDISMGYHNTQSARSHT